MQRPLSQAEQKPGFHPWDPGWVYKQGQEGGQGISYGNFWTCCWNKQELKSGFGSKQEHEAMLFSKTCQARLTSQIPQWGCKLSSANVLGIPRPEKEQGRMPWLQDNRGKNRYSVNIC